MTQSDQLKVIRKGFRIIRADMFRKVIKVKADVGMNWKTLEKGFTTKTAVQKRMDELLKNKLTIED
ncbi:hypothetical protein HZP54_16865 [Elizabethkingia anophelis]|nr:hypothetical protein [Elizabethkingia anophelis]